LIGSRAHFRIWQRRIVPLIFSYWSQIQRFQYQTQGTKKHAPEPIHRWSQPLASVCIPMLVRKIETRQNKEIKTRQYTEKRDGLTLMYRIHEIPGSNKNLHGCQWFAVIFSISSTV
jgi:hypothetical protein